LAIFDKHITILQRYPGSCYTNMTGNCLGCIKGSSRKQTLNENCCRCLHAAHGLLEHTNMLWRDLPGYHWLSVAQCWKRAAAI